MCFFCVEPGATPGTGPRELEEDEAAKAFAFQVAVKPGPLAHKGDQAGTRDGRGQKAFGADGDRVAGDAVFVDEAKTSRS